jgi:hypothetical protein
VAEAKLLLGRRVLGKASKSFASGAWKLNVPIQRKARKRLRKARPLRLTVVGTVGGMPFKRAVRVK